MRSRKGLYRHDSAGSRLWLLSALWSLPCLCLDRQKSRWDASVPQHHPAQKRENLAKHHLGLYREGTELGSDVLGNMLDRASMREYVHGDVDMHPLSRICRMSKTLKTSSRPMPHPKTSVLPCMLTARFLPEQICHALKQTNAILSTPFIKIYEDFRIASVCCVPHLIVDTDSKRQMGSPSASTHLFSKPHVHFDQRLSCKAQSCAKR